MNCCNEYGQCTQGKGCPARQSPTPDEADDSELMYLVSVCIAILACAFGLGFVAGFASHLFF